MAEARILYLATADGLTQLANPGKSDRWREVGRALEGQGVRAVVVAPNDPLTVFATTAKGIMRSTDGGINWDAVNPEPSRALVFDQEGTLYAGTERGAVLHSTGGDVWHTSDASRAPIMQLTVLADDTLLSVAADGTVCERSDYDPATNHDDDAPHDHERWRTREIHVPNVRGLAARHDAPHTLFVVNASSLVMPYGTHRLPTKPTGAMIMLEGDPAVLLIGTEGALLRSDDEGAQITPLDGPSNVTALTTVPRFVDQAFAGTADGTLWFSRDRGRKWGEVGRDHAGIRSIAFARAL